MSPKGAKQKLSAKKFSILKIINYPLINPLHKMPLG